MNNGIKHREAVLARRSARLDIIHGHGHRHHRRGHPWGLRCRHPQWRQHGEHRRRHQCVETDYATERAVSAVDADGGSGHQLAGNLVFAGGDPLSSASGSFAIDGVPGTYQAELVTVVGGGTGYQIRPATTLIASTPDNWLMLLEIPLTVRRPTGRPVAGPETRRADPQYTIAEPRRRRRRCRRHRHQPGPRLRRLCRRAMTVFVDGVENPPGWSIRHTTDANGAITLIDTPKRRPFPMIPMWLLRPSCWFRRPKTTVGKSSRRGGGQ